MRYFINKQTKEKREIGNYTPSVLQECLTETIQVGTEIVDGIEQPKLELIWKELTKEEYDNLQPKEPPIKEPQKTYDELVQEKLIAKGYTHDKQIAILCNGTDTAEHKAEFDEMQAVRQQCKAEARKEI